MWETIKTKPGGYRQCQHTTRKPKKSNRKNEQEFFSQHLTLSDVHGVVKERFASFCIAVGVQALMSMMEQNVETVAGPKGKHNPDRTDYRHGSK